MNFAKMGQRFRAEAQHARTAGMEIVWRIGACLETGDGRAGGLQRSESISLHSEHISASGRALPVTRRRRSAGAARCV